MGGCNLHLWILLVIAISDALFHLLKHITCKRVAIGTCPCPACRPVFVSKLWSLIANVSFHYLIFIFFYSRFVLSLCSHICESDHQILTSKERKSKKSKKMSIQTETRYFWEFVYIIEKSTASLCLISITSSLSHPRTLCWVWQKECISQLDCTCECNNTCNRVLGVSLITFLFNTLILLFDTAFVFSVTGDTVMLFK